MLLKMWIVPEIGNITSLVTFLILLLPLMKNQFHIYLFSPLDFSSLLTHFNVTFLCVFCSFTPLLSAFHLFRSKET